MRWSIRFVPVVALWGSLASAQLQLVPDTSAQAVFGGGVRTVNLRWRNGGESTLSIPIQMKIYQTTSSTAAPWSETKDWKELQVLPRQTIFEEVSVRLPAVKAETRLVIQWLERTNKVLGHTELMVYPNNLLSELKPLMGDKALGVFDPQNQLKPLLKMEALDFEDLEIEGVNRFSGKLAILGPFTNSQAGASSGKVAALAATGVAVVWISSVPVNCKKLKPSFYVVPKGKGTVLVADSLLVADLSENPRSQSNLVSLSRLAVRPESFDLRGIDVEPQP